MKQAYLAGYTSRKPQQLLRLAEMLDAVVVDSRYSPVSRVPYWHGGALRELLGDRYMYNASFGNRTYRQGIITLADPDFGLKRLDHQGITKVIILCACKDGETCHRKQVGEYLALYFWQVREVTEAEWKQAALEPNLPH